MTSLNYRGAYNDDTLVEFLIFSTANFRIKQFGVHKNFRQQKIGTSLFMKLKENSNEKPVSIINLDDADKTTQLFIEKMGLTKFIQQYEMTYNHEN